jgi:mono/diheme cytochrome c family protein
MRKGTIAFVVLLILVVAGIVYGVSVIRHGFSARDQPSRSEALVARTVRSLAIPSGAKNQQNPLVANPDNLAEARAHFADHCAICHANNGSGNTEIGRHLYPKAPDMRLPATQTLPDGELYYTINNGIRLTGMPSWGQAGENDEESWKLVHFIRHLPQLTPAEEHEMESLNPKGPGERQEEQEEAQFLNEDQSCNQAPKSPKHPSH